MRLLHAPDKVKPAPSSTKKIENKSELVINGKFCREAENHIIFCLSKVSRSSVDSLEDRGANGGVTGNVVRVTSKHPDRTADVRGKDDLTIFGAAPIFFKAIDRTSCITPFHFFVKSSQHYDLFLIIT